MGHRSVEELDGPLELSRSHGGPSGQIEDLIFGRLLFGHKGRQESIDHIKPLQGQVYLSQLDGYLLGVRLGPKCFFQVEAGLVQPSQVEELEPDDLSIEGIAGFRKDP